MAIRQARLIFGATYFAETVNTDLFWLVRMPLPDEHVLLEFEHEDGQWERFLLTGSLEFTRAQKQARNCTVINMESYFERFGSRKIALVVKAILEERSIDTLIVHPLTPIEFVEKLQKAGIATSVGELPWYPARIAKTEEEIGHILEVQSHMEDVLGLLKERLRSATIAGGMVMERGKPLTSEDLRSYVELELFHRGCASLDTIISSGVDAAIPHEGGSGPIRANTGIICDIFPYSRKTGFFSDMTRTFIKGEPPPLFIKMYNAVLRAQEMCISMIRPGMDGKDIQDATDKLFREEGFETDDVKGHGFIHGVGHGLGLLCHEPPARINDQHYVLPEGLVVSVEPGLYYPEEGLGVRIEDLVQVTANGCRNLTRFPKDLKSMIIP